MLAAEEVRGDNRKKGFLKYLPTNSVSPSGERSAVLMKLGAVCSKTWVLCPPTTTAGPRRATSRPGCEAVIAATELLEWRRPWSTCGGSTILSCWEELCSREGAR